MSRDNRTSNSHDGTSVPMDQTCPVCADKREIRTRNGAVNCFRCNYEGRGTIAKHYVVRRFFGAALSSVIHADADEAWTDFNAAIHKGTRSMICRVQNGKEEQLDAFTGASNFAPRPYRQGDAIETDDIDTGLGDN